MKNVVICFAVALCALLMSACGSNVSEYGKGERAYRDSSKWGKVTTQELESDDFESIVVKGNIDLKLSCDSAVSIKAVGNELAIAKYEIKVEDGVLNIDSKDKSVPAITLYVSTPVLASIYVDGACDVNMKNSFEQSLPFTCVVNGTSEFEIDELICESMNLTVNGAGDISAKKIKCRKSVEFEVNGAGDIEIDKIKTKKDLKVVISGAGDVDLDVDCENLNVAVYGAGDVSLKGKCINYIKQKAGLSSIDSKGLSYEKMEIR